MPKPARLSERSTASVERPYLISAAEAATILGVSRTTIYRLRKDLRFTRVGGQVLIHEDSVDAYLARNTFGDADRCSNECGR